MNLAFQNVKPATENDDTTLAEFLGDPAAGGEPTQDSVALAFAHAHKGELRYCHSSGSWFLWNGTCWARDRKRVAFDWARKLTRKLSTAARSGAGEYRRAAFYGGVERCAQSDPLLAAVAEEWDADPFLLGTPGGAVDLRTGKLRTANPDDRITKLTAVAPAEAEYCPRWLEFLSQTTGGDAEMIRFLKQWCGYSLTGDCREQSLIFVYGDGGNGKGVFLRAVTGIMNGYAATSAMDTFTASRGSHHPTDLALLAGSRMVSASETEEGQAWAESRIKSLTGCDPITARFMRQDFFTYTPQFKLTIVGNHQPVLKNVDEAMRRRFNIVPFTNKPEQKDPQLDEKLREEWPGILRWMINGCLDWLKHGLIRPDRVSKETKAYFDDQDVFGQWLSECCEVSVGCSCWKATSTELFASWKSYATKAGEEPGTQKLFSERLSRLGLPKFRTKNSRGFEGIYVKADTV